MDGFPIWWAFQGEEGRSGKEVGTRQALTGERREGGSRAVWEAE